MAPPVIHGGLLAPESVGADERDDDGQALAAARNGLRQHEEGQLAVGRGLVLQPEELRDDDAEEGEGCRGADVCQERALVGCDGLDGSRRFGFHVHGGGIGGFDGALSNIEANVLVVTQGMSGCCFALQRLQSHRPPESAGATVDLPK